MSIHARPGAPNDARGSVPNGHGARVHASTLPRITVERHYDRLTVLIRREKQRAFSLSAPEAELLVRLLADELARQVPGVADPGAPREPEPPSPVSRVRKAPRAGRCARCGRRYEAGTLTAWLPGSGPVHASCVPPVPGESR
jgi:hypothetical protein